MGITTLISGSEGFIGAALVRALKNDGRFGQLVGVNRKLHGTPNQLLILADLTSESRVKEILHQIRPTYIFHLAGLANPEANDSPEQLWDDNVLPTMNLAKHALPGCTFVFASSATVYGQMGSVQRCLETDAVSPCSIYGAAKAASEALLVAQGGLREFGVVILRFVANCGPGATHGLVKAIVGKLKGNYTDMTLLGDAPGTIKPFVHVEDSARALIVAATSGTQGVFNVSPDDSLSVEQVATAVMDAKRSKRTILWTGRDGLWPGDQEKVYVSGQKLRNLGWKPVYKTSEEAVWQAAKECI